MPGMPFWQFYLQMLAFLKKRQFFAKFFAGACRGMPACPGMAGLPAACQKHARSLPGHAGMPAACRKHAGACRHAPACRACQKHARSMPEACRKHAGACRQAPACRGCQKHARSMPGACRGMPGHAGACRHARGMPPGHAAGACRACQGMPGRHAGACRACQKHARARPGIPAVSTIGEKVNFQRVQGCLEDGFRSWALQFSSPWT